MLPIMALYLFLQRIQPLLQLSNFCLQGLHIILLAQDISIFSLHIVADIFVAAAVIMAGPFCQSCCWALNTRIICPISCSQLPIKFCTLKGICRELKLPNNSVANNNASGCTSCKVVSSCRSIAITPRSQSFCYQHIQKAAPGCLGTAKKCQLFCCSRKGTKPGRQANQRAQR